MPEIIGQLLAYEGLGWLIFGVFLAGTVRGFTGFGAALVYMPIAAQFMPPVWALTTLVLMEAVGPLPNIPAAIRSARLDEVRRLSTGALLALPLGLLVLFAIDPDLFRYGVCFMTLTVPLLLATGFRLRRQIGPGLQYGVGTLSGFLGGVAGVPGPPVILLYMASTEAARVIRANVMLYLMIFDLAVIALLALQDRIDFMPALLGALLVLPNLLGNLAGAAMFHPDRQRVYRVVGYGIMMLSGVAGLPIWD